MSSGNRRKTSLSGVSGGSGTGLWDRDITVSTLHRGSSVIPDPRSGVALELNDRLLRSGKPEEMRPMIPDRRRRRAKLPADPLAQDVPSERWCEREAPPTAASRSRGVPAACSASAPHLRDVRRTGDRDRSCRVVTEP